jgi:hypothetical protein
MATRSYRPLFLALAVLALAGCATTAAVRLGDQTYPPTTPDQVRIFPHTSSIRPPHRTIAIITAQNQGDKQEFLQALKRKAAALDADAIVVTRHYH